MIESKTQPQTSITKSSINENVSLVHDSEPYNSVESTQASYTSRFVIVVILLSSKIALCKAPTVLNAFVILKSTFKSNFPEASIVDPRYVKSHTYSYCIQMQHYVN